ncbi:toxin YeeV [Escherichia coli HVH 225 (4-1273116)]|nr:toxin YeeV [Escherichia coli HVH 225 (4-1273116)]
MKTLPVLPGQAASSRPSSVEIWQTLLTRLLDQHYGLTLNDTPFADERVIEQHIEAGISIRNAAPLCASSTEWREAQCSNFPFCPER